MHDLHFTIDITLEELFEFIFWQSHYKKYSSLCRHLDELRIPVLTITPNKDGEIQRIIYEKENEFTIRNKFLIDDAFLEPLGLYIHNLIHMAKHKKEEKESVLDEFRP